jgi:hypothetical protein
MKSNSLFGHLAYRFASHPENLATEALAYILGHSSTASGALVRYFNQFGLSLKGDFAFKTQATGDDGAIPDLVGVDGEGNAPILIEAKFWAGLTDHQPLTYLSRLSPDKEGILVFIAPARRIATLWPELIGRCEAGGLKIGERSGSDGAALLRIGTRHIIGLTSWSSILSVLLQAVEADGNPAIAADVRQLQGLCAKMDDDAFLPLRSEELSPQIGTRVMQYCRLVDDATATLVAAGKVSVKGLKATGGDGWYGRYLTVKGNGCCLMFSAEDWGRLRETPIWLSVKGPEWKLTPEINNALAALERESPPRLVRTDSELLIPISLPTAVERDVVLDRLLNQVIAVIELLPSVPVKSEAG